MFDLSLISMVPEAFPEPADHPSPLFHFAQQQSAPIAGDLSTAEIRLY
jgi:hypothetical protein